MKYIFFGTPEFAAIILEKLIDAGYIPEAVVCNPDKPVGRKKIITPPPVKKLLIEKFKDLNIEIVQLEKLEIGNCLPAEASMQAGKLEIDKLGGVDFAIVAAYSKIIPKIILDSPTAKFIGIHPSLLPKYRGPSPIQTAILNGDRETGVSLYLMDEKVDSGPLIVQQKLNYGLGIMSARGGSAFGGNYGELSQKLAELSGDLLVELLRKLNQYLRSPTSKTLISQFREVGLPEIGIKLQPQEETQATYTKKFTTKDAFIEPNDLGIAQNQGGQIALEIDRKIRALNPEPGTWTIQNEKRMKILEAELINGKPRRPGGVGAPTYTSVLKLKKIQFEGKKPTEL